MIELTIALVMIGVNCVLQIAQLLKHSECKSPCFSCTSDMNTPT